MVRLEHIGKRYGTGAQILSDVSLRLEPGGFHFLTGASGAGKTTLLKIVYLAERPSRGRVNLFGVDTGPLDRARRAALRRRMGIVFQDFRLVDDMTAGENVALPLRIAGTPERQVTQNVREILAWVGMADRADARIAGLASEERQRVAIARAIVRRPELLIADEPAGSVDEDVATLLVRAFEQINRLGTTVLIATRDIAFAGQFPHRRFHLESGVIVDAGGPPP